MNPLPLSATRPSGWRRIGVTLALTASLGFAFQPTLLMAQATEPSAQFEPRLLRSFVRLLGAPSTNAGGRSAADRDPQQREAGAA